jgi:WD40 repeat protein
MMRLRLVCTLQAHTNWVYCLAFAPDGRTLASAGWDQVIRLWDVTAGTELAALRGHRSEVYVLAYSPDGAQLAAGSATGDSPLRIWDIAGGTARILEGHSNVVHGVAWSADGRLLLSGGYDRTARVWDAATGTEQALLTGHERPVYGVAFHNDGATLISVDSSTIAKRWNVAGGGELATLPPFGRSAHCVAFSPGAAFAATGYGIRSAATGEAIVWDTSAGAMRARLAGHANWVYSLAFRCTAAGWHRGMGRGVRLWTGPHTLSGRRPRPRRHALAPHHPDGTKSWRQFGWEVDRGLHGGAASDVAARFSAVSHTTFDRRGGPEAAIR